MNGPAAVDPSMQETIWYATVTMWRWAPIPDLLIALAGVVYLVGVIRVRRLAGTWPPHRTGFFLLGLGLLVVACNSGIDTEARTLATVHMVQHVMLIMVVPLCLVVAKPWQLCHDSGPAGQALVTRVRELRVTKVVLNPVFGTVCYAIVLVGTHLTPFMTVMQYEPWLHPVEAVLYLVSGYVFLLPLAGYEPIRRHLAYPIRIAVMLLSMGIDAGIGITLMMSAEPMTMAMAHYQPFQPMPLEDVRWAGSIMWVVGDGLMMVITLIIAGHWASDAGRQNDTGGWLYSARQEALASIGAHAGQRKADGGLRTSDDIDNDDEALAAYNRMLAILAERADDRPPDPGAGQPDRRSPAG